ncbi:hypothetical protein A3A38_01705 [Candidatus Kaiserbacteria bacterium RIFCSPLOWO2_01_FULL_53_17]|uniref:Penicillin-binding protein transpeptidase domain-containing protein n=1 Tax=Candidatus Kaiserbacteria bacterium RIFCSPLOWO2_01_FULL_53_17 TaxID=1798511 RepID=A0A1F6EH51_9BACT|nr:MAG: hypothetical protein A3A38_01705 [Candidatus Kaiserbacteria bacterium RIFCSPLOWO2_01_FULL_53_17]
MDASGPPGRGRAGFWGFNKTKYMTDALIVRIRFLSIVVFLGGTLLVARLFFVQIVRGEAFRAEAGAQYVAPVEDSFGRGSIFFQNKDGSRGDEAATLKSGFTIAINPKAIPDPEALFGALSAVIPDLDSADFFLRAGKKNDPYEEIARRLPAAVATAVKKLGIPGVFILEERWRYYPNDTLAAHLLGFVGSDGDALSGQYGIERYYDHVLKRENEDVHINFFAEIFANLEHSLFYDDAASREGDIVLSVEPAVERFLGNILDAALREWRTERGGGIVINPKTGEIYAMEARPSFNPNAYGESGGFTVFANPLVENVFEMGSIIKPLTVAFGIDSGAITAKSTYYDTGTIEVSGLTIGNYDGKARGVTGMQDILNKSLNLGAVHIMQKTGKETFARYMAALGFGEETGIDLPNEAPGLLDNLETRRDVEFATASYGQGIAVTPIAVVRALSALANGGILVTPHVAERVLYKVGSTREIAYDDAKRVLKKETTEEVTRMLVNTVDTALQKGRVMLPHWSIAAKTGTAQLPSPDGGYYKNKFLHSFFGYFPAYDPQFLVFLYIIDPQGASYSSETLTQPFMDTAKFLINYYGVPPDR